MLLNQERELAKTNLEVEITKWNVSNKEQELINNNVSDIIPYVPLPNEHSGMVDWLCHPRLENKGLKAALKEVLYSQSQDIIKFVLALIKQTIPVHPPQKGFTLKDTTWVLLIQSQ